MKVNKLLSEIIKGQWLMDPTQLLGYAPLVHKIISGESVVFENKASDLLKIIDSSGKTVQSDDDSRIEIPEDAYAVVSMIGPVIKYGDLCTWGTDEIVSALKKADANPNIKAIIFIIDGPGGAVSAIGPFLDFSRTKTKPVIGLADAALSLHYWTACAVCDYLIADNDVSARFGSVGVVTSFVDAQPYYEEKGFVFHEIYAPESEDKNLSFRLALEGKYDMIKEEHLSPIAKKFQMGVKQAFPNLKEEKGVLSGKTFDADSALSMNMIHAIGNIHTAIEMANVFCEYRNFYNL